MDEPLEIGNWPLISASATAWSPVNQAPRQMTRRDMDQVRDDYVAAARRGARAGFDMLELHYAHGYLMSAFITPLLNRRKDRHGGSLNNRLRFPLEVFAAVRAVWPAGKPISVRISSNDWVGRSRRDPRRSGGNRQGIESGGRRHRRCVGGANESGCGAGVRPDVPDPVRRPDQERCRHSDHGSGKHLRGGHVNGILAARRADLCCLARPHLLDPNWTLRAAAQQHYQGEAVQVPVQYESGFEQLERNLQRAAEMAVNV